MSSVSAIALSGMQAASARVGAAAHNIANLGTAGFRREISTAQTVPGAGVSTQTTRAPEPGNAIEEDTVDLLSAKHGFAANLAVFRTADKMTGALLDQRA